MSLCMINGETLSRRYWNWCAFIQTKWRAIHGRTHHLFGFFSLSFFSSSICCSTANAPSKIAYSSSLLLLLLLLLQLSAIAVNRQVCVSNGLHIMTSLTQLLTRLLHYAYVCLALGRVPRTIDSYEVLVRDYRTYIIPLSDVIRWRSLVCLR